MPGAQLQLVSYSQSGSDLTNTQPQITFFKNVYKHYENFAIETIPVRFNKFATPNWTEPMKFQSRVDNIGHLLRGMNLEIQLPQFAYDSTLQPRWINDLAINMVMDATVYIGGEPIHRISGDWLNIFYKRYKSYDKYVQSAPMLNPSPSPNPNLYLNLAQTLTVELPFFWRSGIALPLYNIEYQTIYVELTLRPISEWITVIEQSINSPYYGKRVKPYGSLTTSLQGLVAPSGFFDFLLMTDVVFLEEERFKKLRRTNFEILIEQNVEIINRDIGEPSVRISVNQRLPTKEFWVLAQRNDVSSRNGWDQYSMWEDWRTKEGDLNLPKQNLRSEYTPQIILDGYWTDYYINRGIIPLPNIIGSMSMILDEQVFINEVSAPYMSLAFPLKRELSYNEVDLIYNYGFSLYPRQFAPSGMLNLDRASKVYLDINFSQTPPPKPALWFNPITHGPFEPSPEEYQPWNNEIYGFTYDVKCIFINYNILRIGKGMGDIVFRK